MLIASLLMGLVASSCASPSTQTEINDCALIDFNRADTQLNAQWKITFRNFQDESAENAARLRAAQRAWIAYRDAECDAEHPWDIGVSLDKGLNIMCRTDMTEARIRQLATIAQDN